MGTLADWRALVDKELAGASFDKLVQKTAEGLAIEPLYVDAPANATRPELAGGGVKICMRARPGEAREHLDGGADALWLDSNDVAGQALAMRRGAHLIYKYAPSDDPSADLPDVAFTEWLSFDPVATALAVDPKILTSEFLQSIAPIAADLGDEHTRSVQISTLVYDGAGADVADELAFALSTAVAYLRALIDHGIEPERAAQQLWFQIAIGRDTFGEICKLRALRVLAGKVFAAANIAGALPPIHAVSSARTQAARDPWVNMLRVTTEVFAAAIGGADCVTPLAFDGELAERSALGRRVARNTALVLRDESSLGRVVDAAGGSYYVESRTDALAREAWRRFRAIEQGGGIASLVASGALRERLAASWSARAKAIATRKEPVLGVSEFANLDEKLPSPPRAAPAASTGLPWHRDAEGFEAMRAAAGGSALDVVLVQLGTPAESRARVGFAKQLFATVGVRAREVAVADALAGVPHVACLCGSDESYAAHAASVAAELRDAGAVKIALAGRPGAIEAQLREAGVAAFIYMGCDVLAALKELLP